jgi:hypothetical protein
VVSGVLNQVPIAEGDAAVPGGHRVVLQGGEEGCEEGAIEGAQPAGIGVDT